MTDIPNLPAPPRQQSEQSPPSVDEIIAELSRCLTAVRPVGMSDDAAHEWLVVAAADVRHLSLSTLRSACREARAKCDRHSQILAAILGSDAVKSESQFKALAWDRDVHRPQLEAPRWKPKPGELEQIMQEAAEAVKAKNG